MTDPAQYHRGSIVARNHLLTFEAVELETGRPVYLHLFPSGRDDFQRRLTNDITAWAADQLKIEHYMGAAYVVSPASPEHLDIERFVQDTVDRERGRHEAQSGSNANPADDGTAEQAGPTA